MQFPLGDPPYSAAAIDDFLAWIAAHDAPCSAADLNQLELIASSIGDDDAAAAGRLEEVRTDGGIWLKTALLARAGRFEEAAAALRLLREKYAGEERALIMLA